MAVLLRIFHLDLVYLEMKSIVPLLFTLYTLVKCCRWFICRANLNLHKISFIVLTERAASYIERNVFHEMEFKCKTPRVEEMRTYSQFDPHLPMLHHLQAHHLLVFFAMGLSFVPKKTNKIHIFNYIQAHLSHIHLQCRYHKIIIIIYLFVNLEYIWACLTTKSHPITLHIYIYICIYRNEY